MSIVRIDPPAYAELYETSLGRTWRVMDCPLCHDVHEHGAGNLNDNPYSFLGHRIAHCTKGDGGAYTLVDWVGDHGDDWARRSDPGSFPYRDAPDYKVELHEYMKRTIGFEDIRYQVVTVYVRLKTDSYAGVRSQWWETIWCPYCGGKHEHAAGADGTDPRQWLGVRTAKCRDQRKRGSYRMVEHAGQTIVNRRLRATPTFLYPSNIPKTGITFGLRRSFTPEERSQVWAKTDGHCWYCNAQTNPFDDFQVDHVVPVSKGGGYEIENLVPCCRSCNSKKRAKSADRFIEQLEREGILA